MKSLLAFSFAILGTAFLTGDSLGGEEITGAEKNTVTVSDVKANCNVEKQKKVIPTRL